MLRIIKANLLRHVSSYVLKIIDFDEVMFNLSGILAKFLSKTVQKRSYDLINPTFIYNLRGGLINTNIGIQRNDTAIIDFTSCIFFYKLKFFQISVMVLLSTIKPF
ncbi:hypothetical protein CDIK_0426 [Cucumispora dikerogammari]|nr:hypothetical protein CDIK_0426 [Cucumispora dikerogammari]